MAFPAYAPGERIYRAPFQLVLDPDLVALGYVQIVFVEKARPLAKPKLGKGDIGRIDTEIERTIMRRPQTELKEVTGLPAHA